MSEETAPETRKRGRPAIPKEEKVDLKFHLVLLKEEMEIFKIAAKIEGASSTAFFIRSAIDYAGEHPGSLRKHIPKGLAPSSEDKTTYHYPLLLSAGSRAIVDQVETRAGSEFIRTAALNKACAIKTRTEALEKAVLALKRLKGVD